jgi:hypothetical protein
MSGYAAAAGLSGCQAPLLSETPRIDIKLYNYTSDPQQVQIRILRTDRDEYSDVGVFARDFEVPAPPDDESAGTLEEEDIVDRRPYILRVQPKHGNGQWYHHHYYPGESTTDEDSAYFDVRLYREEATGDVYPRFFM